MSYGVNILVQQRQCGISLWGQGRWSASGEASQDRQGTRPRSATGAARPCRRGDRVGSKFAALHNVGSWHDSDLLPRAAGRARPRPPWRAAGRQHARKRSADSGGCGPNFPGSLVNRSRARLADRHDDLVRRGPTCHPPGGGNRPHARQITADAKRARAGDVDRGDTELGEMSRTERDGSSSIVEDRIDQPLGDDGVNEFSRRSIRHSAHEQRPRARS